MSLLNLPKPFFVLAPMDDVTDTVFRRVVTTTAAPDLYFTEFVNVDGLQSPGRSKLLPKLAYTAAEQPIIAQLWGKTPENYYKSAKDIVAMGFAGVDINMGCPAKPIVQNGCCSALINNRELAVEIIQATQRGVTEALREQGREAEIGHFPVSVKTRLGWNEVDFTWHELLLKQKLNMLTIHGRTKKEMSKVPANWDAIGHIARLRTSLAPDTLIVGNGDVMSRADGLRLAKKHGLDGIMIGRGIFQDPYVFAEQSPWEGMTPSQKIELFTKHVKLFAKVWANNERQVQTLNKFCKVYIEGFPGAKESREKLMAAESTDQLLELLVELEEELKVTI